MSTNVGTPSGPLTDSGSPGDEIAVVRSERAGGSRTSASTADDGLTGGSSLEPRFVDITPEDSARDAYNASGVSAFTGTTSWSSSTAELATDAPDGPEHASNTL